MEMCRNDRSSATLEASSIFSPVHSFTQPAHGHIRRSSAAVYLVSDPSDHEMETSRSDSSIICVGSSIDLRREIGLKSLGLNVVMRCGVDGQTVFQHDGLRRFVTDAGPFGDSVRKRPVRLQYDHVYITIDAAYLAQYAGTYAARRAVFEDYDRRAVRFDEKAFEHVDRFDLDEVCVH